MDKSVSTCLGHGDGAAFGAPGRIRDLLAALEKSVSSRGDAFPPPLPAEIDEVTSPSQCQPAFLEVSGSSLIPLHFGEVVPRKLLFPAEYQRFQKSDRNVALISVMGSAKTNALKSGIAGFACTAIAGIYYLTSISLTSPQKTPTTIATTDMAAVPTSLQRTVNAPNTTEVRFLSIDDRTAYPSLKLYHSHLNDTSLAFVWLRNLPPDAKLSQGLEYGNGIWVLARTQLHDLIVRLPNAPPSPIEINVEMLRLDGSLIAKIVHHIPYARTITADIDRAEQ